MIILLKKLFFSFTLNSVLFLMLIIGIQNSENKNKIDLIIGKTVSLPISFIVGVSFISGSIVGSLLPIEFKRRK